MSVRVLHGDCRLILPTLDAESVDAVITDPPAGIAFMGRDWDRDKGGRDVWVSWLTEVMREVYRVAKPGAHAVVWALPRTSGWTHRALEDAGWEVRDCLLHLFGQGFPKSLDVSKALDKMAGAQRGRTQPVAVPRRNRAGTAALGGGWQDEPWETAPATDLARQWDGWGTALKPAAEFWYLARKPFRGTVAANVAAHGTGGINVDGCRIDGTWTDQTPRQRNSATVYGNGIGRGGDGESVPSSGGRWPANVVLDEIAAAMLDEQSGISTADDTPIVRNGQRQMDGWRLNNRTIGQRYGDSGGASRFFYTSKASRAERNKGLAGMPERTPHDDEPNGRAWDIPGSHSTPRANYHPTVKPLDLMQWLVRLVTPPGGIVLDCFAGSGTTGVAADREGFDAILIEREAEYIPIIEARLRGDCPMFADVSVA